MPKSGEQMEEYFDEILRQYVVPVMGEMGIPVDPSKVRHQGLKAVGEGKLDPAQQVDQVYPDDVSVFGTDGQDQI